MSTARLIVVHVVIALVLGGSAYDILTRQEHWPWSNYPMFAQVHRNAVLSWYRLYGVDDQDREIPLLNPAYLWPLDQSRLSVGLRAIAQEHDSGPRLRDAVANALDRYEDRRRAGAHGGPELRGMRLYSVQWDVVPYATNFDRPSSRMLIAEVMRSGP
jgi:hypothetical protein